METKKWKIIGKKIKEMGDELAIDRIQELFDNKEIDDIKHLDNGKILEILKRASIDEKSGLTETTEKTRFGTTTAYSDKDVPQICDLVVQNKHGKILNKKTLRMENYTPGTDEFIDAISNFFKENDVDILIQSKEVYDISRRYPSFTDEIGYHVIRFERI